MKTRFAVSKKQFLCFALLSVAVILLLTTLLSGELLEPNHGPGNSFGAGTFVVTPDGPVKIEMINAGDLVRAYDPVTDTWDYRPVLKTSSRQSKNDLVKLTIGQQSLLVTPEHVFLIRPGTSEEEISAGKGLEIASGNRLLFARNLAIGDILKSDGNDQLTVDKIERSTKNVQLHSLVVKEFHTYGVLIEGIAVCDGTIELTSDGYWGYSASYSSGSRGGCFPAGTVVLTPAGSFPIESIAAGDQVYAKNPAGDSWSSVRVLKTTEKTHSGDIVTVVAGGAVVKTTGNHPFWVVRGALLDTRSDARDVPASERAVTSGGRWVEAGSLRKGDILLSRISGEIMVEAVSSGGMDTTVYNLSVEGENTYAVSAIGILVHNKGDSESTGAKAEIEELSVEEEVAAPQEPAPTVAVTTAQPAADASAQFNTEEYSRIYEQGFKTTVDEPLSTLSIDVDTAAYSNVRRFLQQGQLPNQDAVRIEECINYFSYEYPDPAGDVPFSFIVELSDCPWNAKNGLLHLGLQAERLAFESLPPNNLVFLLDVSGSMSDANKLPLLQEALLLLVNEMRDFDMISIVVYAGAAGLVLSPTPGTEKEKIAAALTDLRAGGSTAGGAGIALAYKIAKENFDPAGNNRVILATDGDFNVGPSSEGALIRLIEDQREGGVFLTVLGLGMGNYKDSKMEQLADHGNGNYAYIDTLKEAKKVLVQELAGTLYAVAKDVKIQIEFNPAFVYSYRIIGYENRLLAKEDFADDTKDAGELGVGHSVTVLYEIMLAESATATSSGELRYQSSAVRSDAYASGELLFLKFRYKEPDGTQSILKEEAVPYNYLKAEDVSRDFLISSSVAAFGLLLRDSAFKGTASYPMAIDLAEQALDFDRQEYRKDFLGLATLAKWLSAAR